MSQTLIDFDTMKRCIIISLHGTDFPNKPRAQIIGRKKNKIQTKWNKSHPQKLVSIFFPKKAKTE